MRHHGVINGTGDSGKNGLYFRSAEVGPTDPRRRSVCRMYKLRPSTSSMTMNGNGLFSIL